MPVPPIGTASSVKSTCLLAPSWKLADVGASERISYPRNPELWRAYRFNCEFVDGDETAPIRFRELHGTRPRRGAYQRERSSQTCAVGGHRRIAANDIALPCADKREY